MLTDDLLKEKYDSLLLLLGEKETHLALAADAKSMGRSGLGKVANHLGISRVTLNACLKD